MLLDENRWQSGPPIFCFRRWLSRWKSGNQNQRQVRSNPLFRGRACEFNFNIQIVLLSPISAIL
jgi:hypothetical protein